MQKKQPNSSRTSDIHRSALDPPELKHHRATGQAYVNVNGTRRYLGRWGLSETLRKYHAFAAEWLAAGGCALVDARSVTIAEMVRLFRADAQRRYRARDGSIGREAANYEGVLTILEDLYGPTPAADFTVRQLKAVRQVMIDRGWTRRNINRQVVRARSVFRWAVTEGIVPPDTHGALQALPGLRAGQAGVRESEPVRALTDAEIEPVIEAAPPVIADMIEVQLLTGMRPGELCAMRPVDIDTSGPVWLYRPDSHKTQHAGKERVIAIGPRAREIIESYLVDRSVDSPLFSPAESERRRLAIRHDNRNTPLTCGNRPGTNRRSSPKRAPGDRYTTMTYGRAVDYVCRKAFPPPEKIRDDRDAVEDWHRSHRWTPNQLRHTAATRIRREFGLEAARVALGHSTMSVTEQYYAERDLGVAMDVARRIG